MIGCPWAVDFLKQGHARNHHTFSVLENAQTSVSVSATVLTFDHLLFCSTIIILGGCDRLVPKYRLRQLLWTPLVSFDNNLETLLDTSPKRPDRQLLACCDTRSSLLAREPLLTTRLLYRNLLSGRCLNGVFAPTRIRNEPECAWRTLVAVVDGQ